MRKRKSNEQPLKEVFDELLKIYRIEGGYRGAEAIEAYKNVMGPAVANQTEDIRFYEGVLTIKLKSAALKNELSYAREKLVALINKQLEKDLVREIRIY